MSSQAGRQSPDRVFFGLRNRSIDGTLEALQGGLSSNGELLWAHDLLEVLLGLKDRREATTLIVTPMVLGWIFPFVPFRRGLPSLR